MYFKLVSKIRCHFVSNIQKYDTISAHVPKRILRLLLEKYSECFSVFGAILKVTNSSFKKGMVLCRSGYVKKVMKLLAFIFKQPS